MFLWLKAMHIIAVIAWMAGMLYLPRLFVYHADAPKGSAMSETFKLMERRLLKAIINPAMIVVFVTGPLLALSHRILARALAPDQVCPRRRSWRSARLLCSLRRDLREGRQYRARRASFAS